MWFLFCFSVFFCSLTGDGVVRDAIASSVPVVLHGLLSLVRALHGHCGASLNGQEESAKTIERT